MGPPKVLILTISHGAAHRRVALALEKALLARQPSLEVEVVDALALCRRWFRAYYDSYQIPLKYWPALWGWIEGLEHKGSSTGPRWLYRRGAQPLFRFIEDRSPSILVATETGLCEIAAIHKREAGGNYFLVGVDGIDVDRAWAQPEVDLYPIMPGEIAEQLAAAGVPKEKILPCGMPLDPSFGSLPDRLATRARLGVKANVPLLLVLFGGGGFGKPKRILSELEKVRHPFQAVFIAGRNARLKEKIESLVRGRPNCRALGWVDNMEEWLAVADVVVNKPSGLALLEAMSCGLPFLAIDPLAGNERRHCDLIERWGVGHWVRQPNDLAPTLDRLLGDREELERLRQNALWLARPRAAFDAAEAILKLLEVRRGAAPSRNSG